MAEWGVLILLAALLLDWFLGEPKAIWDRVPHPVVLFGKMISFFDERFNKEVFSDVQRYRYGAAVIAGLVIFSVVLGGLLDRLFSGLWLIGAAFEVLVVFVLIAQKSLFDHVQDVSDGLTENGLEGGSEELRKIVGRDPELLDEAGVSRAAIESLSENFSDGVVAPVFWYLVFGLPGILAYKMINTADSMIGYKNDKYLYFGKVAAQIDDIANWLPARLSCFLIAAGVLVKRGGQSAISSIQTAFNDAGLHASPNAGWPEGAMAGGLNIALGGPRAYPSGTVSQAYINAAGRMKLGAQDIQEALKVYTFACYALWVAVLILGIVF